MAKPTRKTRQEQKLPKKKATPSASSLEVARRAGSFPDRAEEREDEPASERPARSAARDAATDDAPARTKRSGVTKAKKAASRSRDVEPAEEAAVAATDPVAASKGRAARLLGFAIAAVAIVVGVSWYADRKPEMKTAPSAAPAAKPGEEVTIFGDKPPKGILPEPLKPAPSNAPQAPKPPEPAATLEATPPPAPSAPAPAASPSAAAKKPAPPPAPKPDRPTPKPDKPAPPAPPKPPPAAPPAAPKPPGPAGDPYE